MKQTLRIIGGRYRGKKLTFPDIEGLRPTPDRVRETLFNWLMADIQGAKCLDAFAGSGALGFEAFSRGAAEVCFIEKNITAFRHLKKNLEHFKSPQLTVIQAETGSFLKKGNRQFDIIFLDPPFNSALLEECLTIIENGNVLAAQGLIYTESAHPPILNQNVWQEIKSKRAGQVYYALHQFLTIE